MRTFWIRLPRWLQVMALITAGMAVLTIIDKTFGDVYVWTYKVRPKVETRVTPIERSADYIVSFIQATYPDSVIKRVDSAYQANIDWRKRIRGDR
jgi:hypothetical protein